MAKTSLHEVPVGTTLQVRTSDVRSLLAHLGLKLERGVDEGRDKTFYLVRGTRRNPLQMTFSQRTMDALYFYPPYLQLLGAQLEAGGWMAEGTFAIWQARHHYEVPPEPTTRYRRA